MQDGQRMGSNLKNIGRTRMNDFAARRRSPDNKYTLDELVALLRALSQQGGRLPAERLLAQQFSVKRHQLRRALSTLRASGDIDQPRQRKRSGLLRTEALVRDTNPLEVVEMRLAIEPALARLAALRASPFEIACLQQAVAASEAGDHSRAADLAFHKTIAAATRNHLAEALYALLREVGTDTRLQLPKLLLRRETEHHRAIVNAIAARDPVAAEQCMRIHLMAVHQRIMEGLSTSVSAA
jgi:DNA-binding FadR family transcriptional regulator